MRILAIDIGTGTQDILLFDTDGPVENSPKLVVPSPTAIAAARIRDATAAGRALVIDGTIAGGGPCWWALEDHLRAGLAAHVTPDAARTFDDDLDRVRASGVQVLDDDTLAADAAARLHARRVTLADLDLAAVAAALGAFGVDADWDGIAVGVFDHGAAPPDVSDRRFRFDYLARTLAADPDARAFAATPATLPAALTRAAAVL
ncbi:MAG: pyruvate formate lyase-activating protein, partial [Chloroflexi bacterium]|nr:pyruvate formate lyase-activating protein [Chloroflexota bacterium]